MCDLMRNTLFSCLFVMSTSTCSVSASKIRLLQAGTQELHVEGVKDGCAAFHGLCPQHTWVH